LALGGIGKLARRTSHRHRPGVKKWTATTTERKRANWKELNSIARCSDFGRDWLFPSSHGGVGGMTLLTRNAARYHTYFPALPIIAPA